MNENVEEPVTLDLEALRLDLDYSSARTDRTSPSLRLFTSKDLKGHWFHVRAGREFAAWLVVMQLGDDSLAIVPPELQGTLRTHLIHGRVVMVMTTQRVFGLWWLPRRKAGVHASSWDTTALALSEAHAGRCIRLETMPGPNKYVATIDSKGQAAPPVWPDVSMAAAVYRAFGGQIVESSDGDEVRFGTYRWRL